MKTEKSDDLAEQTLQQIAEECALSIIRWDNEPLSEFADRLIEEIAEKVIELDGFIDEIRQLDLHEEDEELHSC